MVEWIEVVYLIVAKARTNDYGDCGERIVGIVIATVIVFVVIVIVTVTEDTGAYSCGECSCSLCGVGFGGWERQCQRQCRCRYQEVNPAMHSGVSDTLLFNYCDVVLGSVSRYCTL